MGSLKKFGHKNSSAANESIQKFDGKGLLKKKNASDRF